MAAPRERSSPCVWIERDEEGRPRCVHGWAFRGGKRWRCRVKHAAAARRYDRTPAGMAQKAKWNASVNASSTKKLYDLMRVRGA